MNRAIDLKKMNYEETKSTKEGEVLGLRSWVLGNNRPPTTSHRPPTSLRGSFLFLASYSQLQSIFQEDSWIFY